MNFPVVIYIFISKISSRLLNIENTNDPNTKRTGKTHVNIFSLPKPMMTK